MNLKSVPHICKKPLETHSIDRSTCKHDINSQFRREFFTTNPINKLRNNVQSKYYEQKIS